MSSVEACIISPQLRPDYEVEDSMQCFHIWCTKPVHVAEAVDVGEAQEAINAIIDLLSGETLPGYPKWAAAKAKAKINEMMDTLEEKERIASTLTTITESVAETSPIAAQLAERIASALTTITEAGEEAAAKILHAGGCVRKRQRTEGGTKRDEEVRHLRIEHHMRYLATRSSH